MGALRKLYRSLLLFILIIAGLVLSLLFLRNSAPPRALSSRITMYWLGAVAKAMGVRVKVHGHPLREQTLFVSNHMSWLDIPVLGSIVPVHFLAKQEVKAMPAVGALATRAGTLYIHRGKHESASQAGAEITRVLEKKHNALVFAEGTTSNGHIRKFHSRMLQAAIDADACIQPVAIYYPWRNPQTGCIEANPDALFTGNTSIGESFDHVSRAPLIEVEVHYLPPIDARDRTRGELSLYAYEQVIAAIHEIRQG